MNNYLRILRFLKPYKTQLAVSILLSLLFAASNVFIMPLIRDITREIKDQHLVYFHNHILNAVLLYTIRVASQYSQRYVMYWVSGKIIIDMRMAIYEKFQSLSSDFHEKWKMGDMLTRLFGDVSRIKEALLLNFEKILPQSLTLIGVLGYLFWISWKLTLFSLVSIPVFIGITVFFSEKLKRVTSHMQRKTSDLTHIAQETLSHLRLVKAYTMEAEEAKKFKNVNLRNFMAEMKTCRYQVTLEPMVALLQFFAILAVVWFGGFEVAKGALSGPTLISFFTGIFLLIDPVIELSKVYSTTQQSLASADRFFEVMDSESQIKNAPGAIHMSAVNGRVDFKDISFIYPDASDHVLNAISFSVAPGEVIALVGPSGAGKSTFVNLIPRFWDVTAGAIEIDGIDIRKMDLLSLRKNIGIVAQESVLFRGTILDNIRYGSLDATEDEVIAAAKKANAWEFIEKSPAKLRTRVGDRGQKLSGGQKQRISIARAILRDPRILILDEATSALDSESERLVQDALEKLMVNRTSFIIAHRLSTIMHADKIVVIDQGRVAEIGTHSELLAAGNVYARLYEIQFKTQAVTPVSEFVNE